MIHYIRTHAFSLIKQNPLPKRFERNEEPNANNSSSTVPKPLHRQPQKPKQHSKKAVKLRSPSYLQERHGNRNNRISNQNKPLRKQTSHHIHLRAMRKDCGM